MHGVFLGDILNLMQPQGSSSPVSNLTRQVSGAYNKDRKVFLIILGLVLFAVISGVWTGKFFSQRGVGGTAPTGNTAPGATQSLNEAGITDEAAFPDTAEGVLEEGGVNGEGTHHLARDGGASQNVYLSSTVIDLQSFVGKKIQVWGQTLSGKQAGWLMDVGRVKVVN